MRSPAKGKIVSVLKTHRNRFVGERSLKTFADDIFLLRYAFVPGLFIYGWIILHSYNIELKHNPCFANKETNPPIEETPETA